MSPSGEDAKPIGSTFPWIATDFERVFTAQRNKHARLCSIALPQSISAAAAVAPCTLWCDPALAGLNDAAKSFVDRYGPELLLEFGLKVQCTYALLQ